MVCLLFLCFWMVLGLPGPGGTQHTHTAQRTAHSTGHSTAALHHSAQHVVKGTAKQHCTRQTAHTHTLLYMSARVAEGGFASLSFGIPFVLLAFPLGFCLDFSFVCFPISKHEGRQAHKHAGLNHTIVLYLCILGVLLGFWFCFAT